MEFSEAIKGVPLFLVVVGLVEFLKQFGIKGKWSLLASLLVGLVLGALYQVSLGMPVDLGGWLGAVVYGLGLGLTASGLYDFVDAKMPDTERPLFRK